MSSMSLEVVLELVDRLTGPAREAAKGLEQFGAAARQAGGADAALRPDKWIEEGRAIMAAAEQAKKFEASAVNAAEAEKKVGAAPWVAMTEDIDKATAALKGFTEQIDALSTKKLPGPGRGPGAGGKGEASPLLGMVENAGEMLSLFEGPKAIETIVGGGARLSDETIAQKIAGMSADEIADVRALAVDLQGKFPQFPLTEIMKEAREARAIFTTDEEAKNALTPYLKMAALADRDHPGEGLLAAYPFLRAVEEGGFSRDAAKTEAVFDAMQRAKNAMGAKINAEDYFQVFQRGGAFARQWSMEFIRDELPHLLASLGGDATGMMIATLGEGIMGGHLMGPSLDALDKLGLLDEKKVERKGGHIKRVEPGGVKGADILAHDPVHWAQEVLWPAIQKATSNPDEQMMLLSTVMSNRNELKAAYMGVTDKPQFERTKELIENPLNQGLAAADFLKGDPAVGWQSVKSSVETLAGVASEPAMGVVAKGLDILSDALSGLSRAAAGKPLESVAASTATVAGIVYWLGKGIGAIGQKLGLVSGGAEATPVAGGLLARLGGALATPGPWSAILAPLSLDAAEGDAAAEAERRMRGAIHADGLTNDQALDALRRERAQRYDPNAYESWRAISHSLANAGYDDSSLAAEQGREAGRARALSPDVDTSAIEKASSKAKEAGADLKALGATVAPKVDSSALDALLTKLREAASLVGSINGGLTGASRRVSYAGALHDGPEAR